MLNLVAISIHFKLYLHNTSRLNAVRIYKWSNRVKISPHMRFNITKFRLRVLQIISKMTNEDSDGSVYPQYLTRSFKSQFHYYLDDESAVYIVHSLLNFCCHSLHRQFPSKTKIATFWLVWIDLMFSGGTCADPEGGDSGSGPPPPWKITKI